jgi:ankyrin repeat protein
VKWLVENGAVIDCADNGGSVPLHSAAFFKRHDILEYLLERKADVNAATLSGTTPLHAAVGSMDTRVIMTLVRNQADLDKKDSEGRTPLAVAQYFIQFPGEYSREEVKKVVALLKKLKNKN